MTTTVKHPDRLAEQVNRILANPESWDQETCHSPCGTQHCIAGHGQIASGRPMDNDTCRVDAKWWYGLTDEDADWLFCPDRTLTDLHGFTMAALAGETYFDADGFSRDGYNCHGVDSLGYNRHGYNRHGFDLYGYDRDGYGRDCYDRYGFNRYGYHRDGFNRHGFDLYGYDRDGYDRSGYNRRCLDRHGDSLPLLKIAGDK